MELKIPRKKIAFALLVLLALGGIVLGAGALLSSGTPALEVSPEQVDFGPVSKAQGTVSKAFEVRNAGTSDLEIFATTTSCGCTTAKLEKNLLVPGESATLTVFFNPNFHKEPPGKFDRTIYLKTNDPANREKEIRIFVELTE